MKKSDQLKDPYKRSTLYQFFAYRIELGKKNELVNELIRTMLLQGKGIG